MLAACQGPMRALSIELNVRRIDEGWFALTIDDSARRPLSRSAHKYPTVVGLLGQ